MQERRPIAYFSHTLSTIDRQRPIYERELMVVVMAVQRWRPYLLGQKFVVKTDQRALKFLLEQRVIQLQHKKWISKLLGYDFEVVYYAGRDNMVVDALSRMPPGIELGHISAPTLLDVHVIQAEVQVDPKLSKIIQQLLEDSDGVPHYSFQQGVMKYKDRLVVSKSSTLLPFILHTYHDSVFGGHSFFANE